MADLTTYEGLQEAILDWADRTPDDEDPVVDRVTDFIRLAEVRIANDLRAQELLQSARALLNEPRETLPDDFVSVYSLGMIENGSFRSVRYVDPRDMQAKWLVANGVNPSWYTIVGRQLWFSPFEEWSVETSSDGPDMQLIYWAKPRPLSTNHPTNAILSTYPNIYLYGSLVELGGYTVSDQIPLWKSAYDEAIALANERAEDGLFDDPAIAAPEGIY